MELKNIKGFPKYKVDREGNIYSYKRNATARLKYKVDKDGYLRVNLYKNGKGHSKLVHRLVAETFIKNDDNKPQVDHINRDRKDNRVSNLRWVTCKENINYKPRKEIIANAINNGRKTSRRVIQYDRNGLKINQFSSIKEASKETGASSTHISDVCKGIKKIDGKGYYYLPKTVGGFIWKYDD